MAGRLQPVRGMRDLLPDDCRAHGRVEEACRRVAERYGYGEIRTPMLEALPVFARSLGEADAVQKEMYAFEDRGGETLALRPENTAGVARAVLSNGLLGELPLRLYYAGAMFRYERPQKGRYRQFHQIGVELFGVPEAEGDVEAIALAADLLAALGLRDGVGLQINTLGDGESRHRYRSALVEWLRRHRDALSADSRARLERNPLRVLDSKDEGDRALLAEAPQIYDHLTVAAGDRFSRTLAGLDDLGIAFEINHRIVRGLDYYCHTAFEFVTGALGAQGTVIGGGRYDGLMEQMGGPAVAGVGWAGGIERLAMLAGPGPGPARAIAIVPVGERAAREASILAHRLRGLGHRVDLAYRGNLRRRMQRADKLHARYAVIFGDEEAERGVVTIRDLDSGAQNEAAIDRLGEPSFWGGAPPQDDGRRAGAERRGTARGEAEGRDARRADPGGGGRTDGLP